MWFLSFLFVNHKHLDYYNAIIQLFQIVDSVISPLEGKSWIGCTLKLYLLKNFIQIYEVFHLIYICFIFYEWYNFLQIFKFNLFLLLPQKLIILCLFVSSFNSSSEKISQKYLGDKGESHY